MLHRDVISQISIKAFIPLLLQVFFCFLSGFITCSFSVKGRCFFLFDSHFLRPRSFPFLPYLTLFYFIISYLVYHGAAAISFLVPALDTLSLLYHQMFVRHSAEKIRGVAIRGSLMTSPVHLTTASNLIF